MTFKDDYIAQPSDKGSWAGDLKKNTQCNLCNTYTSYNKTICDPCQLAWNKGYIKAHKDIQSLLQPLEMYLNQVISIKMDQGISSDPI